MTEDRTGQRRGRVGRAILVIVSAAVLWLINVAPGWQSWSLLTADFADVVLLVNASLVLGMVVHIVALVSESVLLRNLADGAAAALSLIVAAQLFRIFPFALASSGWEIAVRALLVLGMIGAFIGVVSALGKFARALHLRAHLR